MKIRNIPRNVPVYSRRLLYCRSTSTPFLSGDYFSSLTDVTLFESRFRSKPPTEKSIYEASSIFIPSHFYEQALEKYEDLINATTLVLGNSDRDFSEPLNDLPTSVRRVYLQNSTIFDPMYHLLPIGLENMRLGANGMPRLYMNEFWRKPKSNRILFGPFSPTHPDRRFVENMQPSIKDDWEVLHKRMSPMKYAEYSSSFKYIAAPRGNGLDTHRFWEALYRGSYPVVIKSNWSRQVSALGIPIVEIDNWRPHTLMEILSVSRPVFDPHEIKPLWKSYWAHTF